MFRVFKTLSSIPCLLPRKEIFRRSNEALHYCHFTGVMKQSDAVCDAMCDAICDAICDDVRDDARAEAKWPRKVAT